MQEQPDGTIDVTIRDLLNLAGLQQKLSADGVPAEVISDTHYPAACVDREAMTQDNTAICVGRDGGDRSPLTHA